MTNFHETMRAGSRYASHGYFAGLAKFGFTGQHTNPVRAARSAAIKAAGGIRQFKKQRRAA